MSLLWILFWTGSDVPSVSNPREPGPQNMVFEETLRFGGAHQGEDYLWVDGQVPVNFDVDRRGHYFVLDSGQGRILEFDASGKYVGLFGKRGEGPAEYQNPHGFQVLAEGALGFDFMMPVGRFKIYDSNLQYSETKSVHDPERIFYLPRAAPNGRWVYAWYLGFDPQTSDTTFKTGIFNQQFVLVKLLSQQAWPRMDPTRANQPAYWEDFLAGQLKSFLERGAHFARFFPDGRVVIADASQYDFTVWDGDLKNPILRVQKEFEPMPFGEADREALVTLLENAIFRRMPDARHIATPAVLARAVEKADLPQWKPPVADIIPLEDSAFLVVHQTDMAEGSFSADLFAKDGHCTGRVPFPGRGVHSLFGTRLVFKNGLAHALETNSEGDNQIARYRYRFTRKASP